MQPTLTHIDIEMRASHPAEGANPDNTGAVDAVFEGFNTVAAIAGEVSGALANVPYVGVVAGVVQQVIKIRSEIQANKALCYRIIDKVERRWGSIQQKLASLSNSSLLAGGKLNELEENLRNYERALRTVYGSLKKHQKRPCWKKVFQRGLDELMDSERLLDDFNIEIIFSIIVDLRMEQGEIAARVDRMEMIEPAPPSDLSQHVLPPRPPLMVERESQLNTALEILCDPKPSRIAILGGGGFGKTTLARTILHDSKIAERYTSRYFLSCEAIPDVEALLLGIGKMLDINATPSAMLASIRRNLEKAPTLLCLDNFETPWEPPTTRIKIEDLLASIADIPHLSLIITIRGTQRPSKIGWSHPDRLPSLSTLSSESARKILHEICPGHIIDDFTQQLLDGIEGIPLGITLISNLLRDGESSKELWTRWMTEQTAVIENGGETRESNLNTSIALSMNSPRMTKDSGCRTLLAALSLLPDGFPLASIEQLGGHLGITGIRKLLQTLRAVALIKPEDNSPRIQMLSPIRLFCHQFLSSEISLTLGPITEYYIGLMHFVDNDKSNPTNYAAVVPEIRNVHSIFQKVYADSYQQDMGMLIHCTAILTDWSRYIGYPNQDTIHMALERSSNHPIPRAECLRSLGSIYYLEAHYTKTEECLREAAELFKQENATISEANALLNLGITLGDMRQFDQAEVPLKASLTLFTQANDTKGQAQVRTYLGNLFTQTRQYSEAEANLTSVLEAFKQIGDLKGIARSAESLALLYNALNDLAKSENFALEALAAAKGAKDAVEEGKAHHYLGRIYLRTDRITDARQALERAFDVFEQLNAPATQLITIITLGQLYIQLDRLSAAEVLLTPSTKLELDIIEIPRILTTLGWVYICADRFDKAKPVLDQALLLFQKFEENWGQANTLAHLGTVYFKTNRLDDAEQTLNLIPDLGQWSNIDMRSLWILGDLYIIKGQLEEAEGFLDQAMANAKEYKSSYQQGNILRSMGTLQIKRGHIDLAIEKFQEALEFHHKAQWVSEKATDFKRLGEAYEMSGRSEAAAAAFKEAEELMESVRKAQQLAL